MCPVSVGVDDVAERHLVELRLTAAACDMTVSTCQSFQSSTTIRPLTSSIDGEENGPRHERSDETNGNQNLEQSQEEEVVERVVVKNVFVLEAAVILDPAKHGVGWLRCLFTARRTTLAFIFHQVEPIACRNMIFRSG